jgi:acetyl-CoA C-acetyltransferase
MGMWPPLAHLRGAYATRFGRRPEDLLALLAEAGRGALDDAGVSRPDRLLVACQNPEEFAGEANLAVKVADALGFAGIPAVRIESAPSSGASAVESACHAIDAGAAEAVLVVGGEKMAHRSSQEAAALLAKMLAPRERAYGLTLPSLAALQCSAAMQAYGWTREDLARIPQKAHRRGADNPKAQFHRRVTVRDVLESPLVAPPLRLLDCAPITDGAAAVVVAREGPVRVRGIGHATDLASWTDRRYGGWLHRFEATTEAAERAFRAAKLARSAVDVVETHDAFSHLELANLVDLRLFPPQAALRALRAGDTDLGGSLPVNVSGGLKARGHPLGATGVVQLVELFDQLLRRGGRRQVDGARVGLAHNIGGFGNNVVVTVVSVGS